MDHDKLKSGWFANCDSSSDLSIILSFSMKYAESSNTKHTTRQLIELYKVCHKMVIFLKEESKAKALCYKIATLYDEIAQYNEALNYFMECLRTCQETCDVAGEGKSYCNIGIVYESLCQYEEAMKYHKKHLHVCHETGNLAGERRSYCNIGNVYESLGQYEEAIEYHKKDLRICQETGDREGEGTSYGNIGVVRQALGEYKEAIKYHKKHLCISQETGDVAGEGRSYSNIGIVYKSLGQYEEGIKYYKKALRICQETGDVEGEGKSYGNIGVVYKSLGQYEKAIECHKIHLRICQETGDVAGEASSYANTGNVYLLLGQYEEAMEYHKKHLRICQERGNVVGEASSYCNTGNVYVSLGQYEEAMEYHKKYLRMCQKTGDVVGEGTSYGNIGTVYLLLGQYEQAMDYYKKHLRVCKETGDVAGEGGSYSNFGIVYEALGQYEDAMEHYKKSLRICQETGNVIGNGKSYWNIGVVCVFIGDIQGAEDNLRESLRWFEEVFKLLYKQDDYKVSILDTYIEAYHLLKEVLIASGKKEEALLVSERGRSQALKDKLIRKYGLQNEGDIGELPIDDISSLVGSSNSTFLFLTLSSKKVSIFVIKQGKELYFNVRERVSFAFCFDSDRSNITLPEILMRYVIKVIEDANKYINSNPMNVCEDRSMNQDQDMYHNQQLDLGDPLSVDDVADSTTTREEAAEENAITRISSYRGDPTVHSDSDSAIIESQIEQTQEKQSELTFGTSTDISNHEGQNKFPFPSCETFPEECDDTSSGNSTANNQQDDDHNCDNLFNDLYQVLIAPVREALTEPEIVIIPEGPLFFVPFAALKEKGQPFLSENKRIRLGPSLTTLKLLKECPIEKHCKKGALIVGGPITGSVMFRGGKKEFSDLPYARQEALMIGDILGAKPLIGTKATKDEVIKSLQEGVAIIHIATHANAATGELLLAPGPCAGKDIPDEEDYILTIKDIYASGINAQLAVLSCCHSGRGNIKAEGVVGLTRAFLAAGARSVLASLWAVDDAATSYFMWHFYQHLKSGESACASLQHAMKEMRKTREWSHPYYWAPFFIVGDDIRITTPD